MQFTSSRKVTLAAAGHVVVFVKGETKFLPPALRQKAVDEGLEPEVVEGQVAPAVSVSANDTARIEAIKAGMKVLLDRNARGDFDGGGLPTAKAVKEVMAELGTAESAPKDKNERMTLWAEVQREV